MSDIAIRVEGLSKRYRIGARERYRTLRDSLTDGFLAPFRGVKKLFGGANGAASGPEEIWALKDVSFEVKRGEVIGVIGRNGSGKTTLLKILSRITEPTEGRAEIEGRVGSLLEVGTGFHPELTGRENVYLNGAILGMRKVEIDRKFDEIVAFAEVEKFIDTPVKHYSSGMHVRLAFSVAAHLEPEILLVDEVLAVGDDAFQKKCLRAMGDIASLGRTILFVSHNMTAIRGLCSRTILLGGGRVALIGDTPECVGRYLVASNSDLPGEVDTSNLPRPAVVANDETLRITRVRLHVQDGCAVLWSGEPIEVSMEFRCASPLSDVVFGWAVHACDGARIFECRSTDTHGKISNLEPGSYRIGTRIEKNMLSPGLYSLHVGARCASKGLEYLPEVIAFRVESRDRLSSVWLEGAAGLIRVNSSWTAVEGPIRTDHRPVGSTISPDEGNR